MATKFLEPGGDADFGVALFDPNTGTITAASDFVRSPHQRSIKYAIGSAASHGKKATVADAGGRMSVGVYLNALPTSTASIIDVLTTGFGTAVLVLRLNASGALQLFSSGVQLGSTGSTIGTAGWHRLSFAYKITSTTAYTFNAWLDGVSALSVSNTGTLAATGTADVLFGNVSGDATLDMRLSDFYIDNSSALTDPGNIWVTAKRPFSNGTTNGFTTQIGSGGSGYGSGHAPQVNERPLSTTNGWSMVGAGSAITEEYSIEGVGVGDISIAGNTIVDYMGWVDAKSLASETASLILAGVTSNISLTSTATIFEAIAGSTTYPAGGTDIGIKTTTALTTVSLYEAGVVVAYIPNTSVSQVGATLTVTAGTQAVATVNRVAIAQVGATITATTGTESIATVKVVSIAQAGATLTVTGGTQASFAGGNATVAQVGATITATGGTQASATVQDVSISQTAATLTVTGGTQALAAVNDVAIAQLGAVITASGGTQAPTSTQYASVTQVGATLTATTGTEIIQTDGTVAQVGATLTVTGGTQNVATVDDVTIAQVGATLTVSGGTQATATVQDVSVTQVGATLTATGGTQAVVSQVDQTVAQVGATLTVTGGTQAVLGTSGLQNVSITQAAATLTVTGGLQVISVSTSPLPPAKSPELIFLTDGRIAYRISNTLYLPL